MRLFIPLGKLKFNHIAISPDGRQVVFSATDIDGKTQLYLRPLDALDARPLPGTNEGNDPFWSPDSRSVGFFADGKLKRIEAAGGPVQIVCESNNSFGASWGTQGRIIFVSFFGNGVSSVAATGGAVTDVTTVDTSRQEYAHLTPRFLPDGNHFLYFLWAGGEQERASGVYVGSLDAKEKKHLVLVNALVGYAPPGYLLFLRGGTLFAQSFDADKLELSGESVPLAEGIGGDEDDNEPFASVSQTGVLVYAPDIVRNARVTIFDRTGASLGQVGPEGDYAHLSLSPDETRVVVDRLDVDRLNGKTGFRDLWLMELARGTLERLTINANNNFDPAWSPDGKSIAFTSDRAGHYNLYEMSASGGGDARQIIKTDTDKTIGDWSRDGQFLIFTVFNQKAGVDIWALPLSNGGQPFPFLQTQSEETQPKLSPDGHWLAYASNESGNFEIYVQSFPAPGGKRRISIGGGLRPFWRGDGKELFYLAPDKKLMAVEIEADSGALTSNDPKPLFETRLDGQDITRETFVVTNKGDRFIVINPVEGTTSTPLTVVLNWMAGLKRWGLHPRR